MTIYTIHYCTIMQTTCSLGVHISVQHHYDKVLAHNADYALMFFDYNHKDHIDMVHDVEIVAEITADY